MFLRCTWGIELCPQFAWSQGPVVSFLPVPQVLLLTLLRAGPGREKATDTQRDKGTPGQPAVGATRGSVVGPIPSPGWLGWAASILLKGLKILLAVNQPLLQGHGPCPSVGGRSRSAHHLCLTTVKAQSPGGWRESHLWKASEWPSTAICPQGHGVLMRVAEGSRSLPCPWTHPSWMRTLWEGSLATSGSRST